MFSLIRVQVRRTPNILFSDFVSLPNHNVMSCIRGNLTFNLCHKTLTGPFLWNKNLSEKNFIRQALAFRELYKERKNKISKFWSRWSNEELTFIFLILYSSLLDTFRLDLDSYQSRSLMQMTRADILKLDFIFRL